MMRHGSMVTDRRMFPSPQDALEPFRFPDPMDMRHELDKQAIRGGTCSLHGTVGMCLADGPPPSAPAPASCRQGRTSAA